MVQIRDIESVERITEIITANGTSVVTSELASLTFVTTEVFYDQFLAANQRNKILNPQWARQVSRVSYSFPLPPSSSPLPWCLGGCFYVF